MHKTFDCTSGTKESQRRVSTAREAEDKLCDMSRLHPARQRNGLDCQQLVNPPRFAEFIQERML